MKHPDGGYSPDKDKVPKGKPIPPQGGTGGVHPERDDTVSPFGSKPYNKDVLNDAYALGRKDERRLLRETILSPLVKHVEWQGMELSFSDCGSEYCNGNNCLDCEAHVAFNLAKQEVDNA